MKNKHLISGIIIVIFSILTFLAFFYSFLLIFNQEIIAFINSLVVSVIFYNIYKLNLITLTPNKLKYTLSYTSSLGIRVLFLSLISLSISKPLESLLFGKIPLGIEEQSLMFNLKMINSEYPEVWLFTIIFMLVYLSPFFIKMTINPSNSYSRSKLVLNEKIIEGDYRDFKVEYSRVFENSIGLKLEVIERYSDPPFNTKKRKKTLKTGSEKDFLNHLHGF